MHDELWAGVFFKLRNAEYFWDQMGKSLVPAERGAAHTSNINDLGSVDGRWQHVFCANLDAFLAMTRSIPGIIQCCFGKDVPNKTMKNWWSSLPPSEQQRRETFQSELEPEINKLRKCALNEVRDISLHRTGYPTVVLAAISWSGVRETGTAINPVQSTEAPYISVGNDPASQWAGTLPTWPLRPSWPDFKIGNLPLFDECQKYLQVTRTLVDVAQETSKRVHGNSPITTPPS